MEGLFYSERTFAREVTQNSVNSESDLELRCLSSVAYDICDLDLSVK